MCIVEFDLVFLHAVLIAICCTACPNPSKDPGAADGDSPIDFGSFGIIYRTLGGIGVH